MLQMIAICPSFGIGFYLLCSLAARGLRALRNRSRPEPTAQGEFAIAAD